jgi:hypothetical protein
MSKPKSNKFQFLSEAQSARENISKDELEPEATKDEPKVDQEKGEVRQPESEPTKQTEPIVQTNPQPKPLEETTATQAPQTGVPKTMGRPKGNSKRSKVETKEYTQVTAYIKSATHKKVKTELINGDTKQDFSDLVQELLEGWLEARS